MAGPSERGPSLDFCVLRPAVAGSPYLAITFGTLQPCSAVESIHVCVQDGQPLRELDKLNG